MEKDVWKWLFSEIPDRMLVQIACGINESITSTKAKISVKGISDLNKIKNEQIRLFRSRLESEINKPNNIIKAKNFLRRITKYSKSFEKIKPLCAKETNEIWNEIQLSNNLEVVDMIVFLMIQTDSKQIEKGIDIYNRVLQEADKKDDSVQTTSTEEIFTNAELENRETDVSEYNIKFTELHAEITSLREEILRLENDNSMLKSDQVKLLEEKKEIIKQNKDLKKNLDQECGRSNDLTSKVQKLEREKQTYKAEIGNRDKKISELQDVINKSRAVEIDLNKQIEDSNYRIKVLEEEKNALHKEDEQSDHDNSVRKITIIDRNMPDGLDAIKSFTINMIIPNELEQSIISNAFEHSDEIWFMKFKLSEPKQNLLREKYGTKVTGFSNYNELKKYCNIQY